MSASSSATSAPAASPAFRTSAAACSPRERLRHTIVTFAPARASNSAADLPTPEFAPVTTAACPFRRLDTPVLPCLVWPYPWPK